MNIDFLLRITEIADAKLESILEKMDDMKQAQDCDWADDVNWDDCDSDDYMKD